MEFEKVIKEITSLRNEDIKLKNIEKHIKRTYCPVKEKIEFLEKIKELSIVNGEFKLYLNKIYLTVGILVLYTDIKLNNNETDYVCEVYDKIVSSDFISIIVMKIAEDMEELLAFNGMIIEYLGG